MLAVSRASTDQWRLVLGVFNPFEHEHHPERNGAKYDIAAGGRRRHMLVHVLPRLLLAMPGRQMLFDKIADISKRLERHDL